MFKVRLIVGLLLFCGLPLASQAYSISDQFTDPVDGRFDMGGYLAENAYGFLPVPIVMTEPALGYGAGFFGLFLHESEEDKEKREKVAMKSIDGGARLIPPAVTLIGGAKTENDTWFAAIAHRRSWNNDSIRYFGAIGYANINIDIYKDFNQLPFSFKNGLSTQTQGYGDRQTLEFRVADSPWYLGVAQTWGKIKVGSEDNRLVDLALKKVLGEESKSSAVGLTISYDSTDNYFFPTEGTSFNGRYMWYSDIVGSDYEYDEVSIDGQHYFQVAKDWNLALSFDYQSLTTDDASLPPLSNPYINMRGISRYRYQDNYVSTVQTQLAWDIDTRWTLLGFVGVGSAAPSFNDLYSSSEVAYGAGFRYKIARRYGLRFGMDFAFSDEDNAFYFNVGSGF